MYSVVFITSCKEFSISIKDYFIKKNNVKNEIVPFYCFGTDKDNEKSIYDELNSKKRKDLKKIIIFSDLGKAYEVSKNLKKMNPEIFWISNGSIIESGFISYLMLNTKAPIKSIEKFIDNPIGKKEVI